MCLSDGSFCQQVFQTFAIGGRKGFQVGVEGQMNKNQSDKTIQWSLSLNYIHTLNINNRLSYTS